MRKPRLENRHRERVDRKRGRQRGKIGWALLWLLGVPLPVLLFVYLIRGCQ